MQGVYLLKIRTWFPLPLQRCLIKASLCRAESALPFGIDHLERTLCRERTEQSCSWEILVALRQSRFWFYAVSSMCRSSDHRCPDPAHLELLFCSLAASLPPWQPLSPCVILLFRKCCLNEIICYVTSWNGRFSLSIIPLGFVQVVSWVSSLFLFIVEYMLRVTKWCHLVSRAELSLKLLPKTTGFQPGLVAQG